MIIPILKGDEYLKGVVMFSSKRNIMSRRLEKKINLKLRNGEFRKEFYSNPTEVLKREGVSLNQEKEKQINEFMKEITLSPKALEMASIEQAGFIGISISFKPKGLDTIRNQRIKQKINPTKLK